MFYNLEPLVFLIIIMIIKKQPNKIKYTNINTNINNLYSENITSYDDNKKNYLKNIYFKNIFISKYLECLKLF